MSNAPNRAWQRMLSGRRLDLLDPSPMDIEISDIAHGLARVARWNGQTLGDHAFSVAQHCLLVEELFSDQRSNPSPSERLYALLHDAAEYVIGDMISPFKAVMGGHYRDVEKRLDAAINIAAGLKSSPTAVVSKAIKRADHMAAYLEATQLAGFEVGEAKRLFEPPPGDVSCTQLTPLPAKQAQMLFLERFEMLRG
ncbi:MAG: HD family hydrolase [Ahrensia sp.]|nr:HD family hydrolase [Ahrensia sp.]